jgi:sialate O-acetylesterase
MKILRFCFILIIFCSALAIEAKVSVPKIFSDNMVLQRETPLPVWGRSAPGGKITVSFNRQTTSTTADQKGNWSLELEPEKAGGPFILTIKGENTLEIKNVLVGEVWLCSGQSNMEWTVGQSMNAESELRTAENPNIRHLKVPRSISGSPESDFKEGGWQVSNPVNTKDFTAVGYFFARRLYDELKVPIGLINSTWGGTNIETWISREGFESSDEFREMIAKIPRIDFEQLAKQKTASKTREIEAMQGAKLGPPDLESFSAVNFNDTRLPALNTPSQWEGQILGETDGVIWYRTTFTLTAEQSRKKATLSLAKIDDTDITYVNGREVGQTNRWDLSRVYAIPAGILREGQNSIVVKVTDTGGGGGIYGNPADLKLALEGENISLAGKWKFHVESLISRTSENEYPSLAYNAMINPLVPYAFRGVLWYQGESNAGRAFQYRTAFPLLVDDWRKKWKREFPFYFVQLATYATAGDSNAGSDWAELREAQAMTLKVPHTGMAVTTDIGDPKDIHPTNKQDVGKRLAALALNRIYGKRMIDGGPTFKSIKVEGNKIVVSFENTGGGLMSKDRGGQIFGFEVAGSDQRFYPATARIEGNTVVVTSDKVSSPVAVRFGWAGDASANNLFNREGFPAVPFRTDDWKTVTKEAKYKSAGL